MAEHSQISTVSLMGDTKHEIHIYQPQAVVAAIQAVVRSAETRRPLADSHSTLAIFVKTAGL